LPFPLQIGQDFLSPLHLGQVIVISFMGASYIKSNKPLLFTAILLINNSCLLVKHKIKIFLFFLNYFFRWNFLERTIRYVLYYE
jgi:hypothetical protein